MLVLFLALIMMPAFTSCAKKDYNTVTVIKPKTKKKAYNPQKDKGKKRTKKVKVQN
ncbi:MAG: hypothetical protein OER04_11405 [Cyclobacteriaceae bacterium]|nr:hypothetical protein [Cyclobacteriaceae bacterium]